MKMSEPKKRIAFFVQDLFFQGAQYVTALLTRGFVEKGYQVDVVALAYHQMLLGRGLKPFAVPKEVNWVQLKAMRARQSIGELRRYMMTSGADYLIPMAPPLLKAVRIACVGLSERPKIAYVEHGLAGSACDGSRLKPPRFPSWRWFSARWNLGCVARVLTVSDRGRTDFAQMNPFFDPADIRTVYNPVVDDVFYRKIAEPTRCDWLINKKCFTFVTAGVFEDYKGQDYLLSAMKILRDQGERIRVVLFGKGSYEQRFRKYIAENRLEDHVMIAGYTNNLPAELKAADAFVLPSIMESFGVVLVEALASGIPVVSADAPYGPREILADGRFGTLVPVRDARALAAAMLDVSRHPRRSIDDLSWRRFTLQATISRYENALWR